MRKRSLFLLLCLAFTASLHAQDYTTTELYLNIKTDDDRPVPNIAVWIVETVSGEELNSVTNSKGSVNFTVYKGKTYTVNFKDKKEHTTITISEKQTTLLAKTIRYTPPEMMGNNTVEIKMDTINQNLVKGVKPKKTETLVHIKLENTDGMPVKNVKLGVVFTPLKTVYVSTTNDQGVADFLLLNDKEYKVDVANIPNYHTFFTPPMGGLNMDRTIKFEGAGIVSQDTINDTIHQVLPVNVHATSMEAYVNVLVNNYDGVPLANEEVYLNIIGDSVNVYYSKTGTGGQAKFLLPKGKKYVISFKYDRDVDVLDYATDTKGNIRTEVEFTYIGTAKIEEFYALAKRNNQGFLLDFMSVEAGVTTLDKKLYYEKTDIGFNLFLGNGKYMMPPTIYEDQIFTSGGVNDRIFLSFNRFNGDFEWGAQLKEGGVSASICVNGVVLLITESCTLYAFDTKTGKPLWGKWLSSYMFSSPTANDKYVYAVYKDDMIQNYRYVFICMELKTGNVVWQTEVDSDILTAPVLADENVYVTTQKGSLLVFNSTTGKPAGTITNYAATLPTITSDRIFVGEVTEKNVVTIKCYTKDFKPVSTGTPLKFTFQGDMAPFSYSYIELMYHSGFRITNNGNLNFNMINNELICSDPSKQTIIWRKKIFSDIKIDRVYPATYQPVIAGNTLIVATPEGLIQLFEPKTGKLIKQYVLGKTLLSQPVAYEGWIFIGTIDGYLMGIDTKDNSITGWPTWGGNAGHNTVK